MSVRKFKCDECEIGVVKVTRRETKYSIDIKVSDCSKCKKPHGLKSASTLEEIKANELPELKPEAPFVLTLWQPWATLHAAGLKEFETRPKPLPEKYKCGPVLIHAAANMPAIAKAICNEKPFKSALLELGYSNWKELPTGAIVGQVQYTGSCTTEVALEKPKSLGENEIAFGNYEPGRFCWLTRYQEMFGTPIPYKNGQGYYLRYKGDLKLLPL